MKMSDHSVGASQSTLFAEDSPAKTLVLPESARAWLESEAASGGSSTESLVSLVHSSQSSKTSPAFYPATKEGTWKPSSARWSNSGIACAGGCLTLSTSEWPKDAAVCSLSEA